MTQNDKKRLVAQAALRYVEPDSVIGVGTGSTANCFIDALGEAGIELAGAVASSDSTAERLRRHHIPLVDLNSVDELALYIDGADEATRHRRLIKGGGGALTREKIVAAVARQFVCIIDDSKLVKVLGSFPLPVEVIPMARSHVGRQLVKRGGRPEYRQGFTTDNGNLILDVHNLSIIEPAKLEADLNNIPGVVCNGIFALRPADLILVGTDNGVEIVA